MKRSMLVLTALSVAMFGAAAAHADTATYTETATASGSLDGTAFSNELVTITLTGDTGSVTNPLPGIYTLVAPTTVSVGGVGSDNFTDLIQVVANQLSTLAGFGDTTTNVGILFDVNSLFATYDLKSSIGPVSGSSEINVSQTFKTSGGTFDFTSAENATFTAVVTPTATPEASSLLMLATGLLALAGIAKRRVIGSAPLCS